MSEVFDVKPVVVNIGALSNAFQPIVKVPSGGGGWTLLAANYIPGATSGTSALLLCDLGTAGTALDHYIADFGTVVNTAKTPAAGTLQSNPFVDAGHWIGLRETNTGATPTVSIIGATFINGKGA